MMMAKLNGEGPKMENQVTIEITVADLLNRWPEIIPFFVRRKFSCIGCSMARFDTLQDVAINYHLDPQLFLEELLATIATERTAR
jgi:hybrid cluster-associated redox disulfide protein